MTHADKVRKAERAVLMAVANRRAAQRLNDGQAMLFALAAEDAAHDEWERERAATCPACGGRGEKFGGYDGFGEPVDVPCPAGCDHGRKVGA